MTLPALLNKQDGFELVRDQIAVIINDNQAAQVILAAGQPDPSLWKLRVFVERSNPMEQFLNAPGETTPDKSPLVNVWYESGTFDQSKGGVVTQQAHAGAFNIDVYGWGLASDDGLTGQVLGDEEAAKTAQRGIRLVRNFLMAGENTYLGFPRGSLVWSRWVESITAFQPDLQNGLAHQIAGARLTLRVEFTETAPEVEAADVLKEIGITIKRKLDELTLAQVDNVFP